jgi:predicted nucleic acid-binding protein
MTAGKEFLDTNVVLYLLSSDAAKANRAEKLVSAQPVVSVQVLNEAANVMRKKLAMTWTEIDEVLVALRANCRVEPLTVETHETGLRLAREFKIGIYDAMIAASALIAGCTVLCIEDMHDGLVIDKRLKLRNPFAYSGLSAPA